MSNDLSLLLQQINACMQCAAFLPFAPKPVLQAGSQARLLIIGQAPGIKAHQTGKPWDDASGRRLRQWLNISDDDFYNADKVAIVPMGFCYPGKGKNGDLPPRAECAPLWHNALLHLLPNIQLTLYIGQYAQQYYLHDGFRTLTERVKNYAQWPVDYFCLPHPSPRNQIWLRKNPWFENEALPLLQARLAQLWAA